MIKLYKIKIGEKVYEVELEAVSEKEGKIETEAPKSKEVKEENSPKLAAAEGTAKVEAPMQGLVVSIDVSSGQKVKAGETLIVLEAMKMETNVLAPREGIIDKILVEEGKQVEAGELIIELL